MFKVMKTTDQGAIDGVIVEYICTELSDIDKLPKFNVAGTQEGTPFDNAPCGYGSTAIVCTGSETKAYMLMPNNQWTVM